MKRYYSPVNVLGALLCAKPTIVASFVNAGAPLKFVVVKEGPSEIEGKVRQAIKGGCYHVY